MYTYKCIILALSLTDGAGYWTLFALLLGFMLWCPGGEPGRPHHTFIAVYRSIAVSFDIVHPLRRTLASRWRMRASMRWIQQCEPLQWLFAPLLGATIWPFNSRWIGAFSNARLSERALCCSRRRNAVFVASRIIRQMLDFWYFVGSSDYEPYRWHLSDFNISMWLLIPAVFLGKLHFHWGGKQRMYDINSGRLVWLWAWLRSPPFS